MVDATEESESAAHAPIGASEPMSAAEIAKVRSVWESYGPPTISARLLATVDAKDREIALLRAIIGHLLADVGAVDMSSDTLWTEQEKTLLDAIPPDGCDCAKCSAAASEKEPTDGEG